MLQPVNSVLYHGTAQPFSKVDVSMGRDKKDFGKGFYMSFSKEQAVGMMHKKYRQALARRPNIDNSKFKETLYEITIDLEYAKTLNVKEFKTADEQWLDFILMCREKGGTPHSYDLIIGPTADDDTMVCLNSYWRGFYGDIGSDEAKDKLLKFLEPENLGIQVFVGKQEVADRLIVSQAEIPWR